MRKFSHFLWIVWHDIRIYWNRGLNAKKAGARLMMGSPALPRRAGNKSNLNYGVSSFYHLEI